MNVTEPHMSPLPEGNVVNLEAVAVALIIVIAIVVVLLFVWLRD